MEPLFYVHAHWPADEVDDAPESWNEEAWPVVSVHWSQYSGQLKPYAWVLVNLGHDGLSVVEANGFQLCRQEAGDVCQWCVDAPGTVGPG